ncbi:MAG: protein-L-isoaspartate O-methyltransferase, partial [Colwellia sp.]|nr:protein-L-isoaspartate O-methyltransferase [Colwellia sp.]
MNVRVRSRIGGKSSRSGEILAQKLHDEGIVDLDVLQAIARTPRHIFVPEILAHKA